MEAIFNFTFLESTQNLIDFIFMFSVNSWEILFYSIVIYTFILCLVTRIHIKIFLKTAMNFSSVKSDFLSILSIVVHPNNKRYSRVEKDASKFLVFFLLSSFNIFLVTLFFYYQNKVIYNFFIQLGISLMYGFQILLLFYHFFVDLNKKHLAYMLFILFLFLYFYHKIDFYYLIQSINILNTFVSLCLFDLAIAQISKDILKKEKQKKLFDEKFKQLYTKYLVHRNYINLSITIFISLIALLYTLEFFQDESSIYKIFMYILLVRLFSRSFEICVAFYKDVTSNNQKNSSLKKHDRIKLAIKSLLEIIILHTSVGYLIKGSFTMLDWLKSFMYSISVSFFNVSFPGIADYYQIPPGNLSPPPSPLIIQQILHVTQVTSSIILITFSVAIYLTFSDKKVHRKARLIKRS